MWQVVHLQVQDKIVDAIFYMDLQFAVLFLYLIDYNGEAPRFNRFLKQIMLILSSVYQLEHHNILAMPQSKKGVYKLLELDS